MNANVGVRNSAQKTIIPHNESFLMATILPFSTFFYIYIFGLPQSSPLELDLSPSHFLNLFNVFIDLVYFKSSRFEVHLTV